MWPFAAWIRSSPAIAGTSANSAGWEIAKTTPSSAVSASTGTRLSRKPSTRASTAPSRGDQGEQAARLDPVDQEAGVAGDQHRGAEEADPEGGDGEARVADLLDVQPECDHRHPVAQRREADRAADQAKIAVAKQARAHVGRIGRCASTDSGSASA